MYQLSPTYTSGAFTVGAAIVGSSSAKDAQGTPYEATLPAYTVVNAFASYAISKDLTATFGMYNLTNTLGYTEINDGRMAARSINGRSAKVGLKYNF